MKNKELVRVQLVAESSGWGYKLIVGQWAVEDPENLAALTKLSRGGIVQIPIYIAEQIANLVNVETGEMVSIVNQIRLSEDALRQKYKKEESDPVKSEIKESVQKMKKSKKKIKPTESEGIDKPVETEGDDEFYEQNKTED